MQQLSPDIGAVHIALSASYLGTQLDRRYRLDRLIGEGASAWVFAAQDLRLERDVAVKVLKPRLAAEQAEQRRRFVAEGRTLAKLVHPHVVLVHDAGETSDGLGYLVMELSDAGSLEGELFRRGTLPAEEVLRLLLPLLGALACAHDRGIVHRDLKPANIALVRERGETYAKLLDFGIAKQRDAAGSTGSAVGTPSYMAPEQARGERLSATADVWALGVVFFRCLSGRLPFDAQNSLQVVLKLVLERAPHFRDVCSQLGPHLAVALDRALEPDPGRRYQDMRSFARALATACAQDRIVLPHRPEPIGLPDFEAWAANADVETTGQIADQLRGEMAVAVVPSLPPAVGRRKRAVWILASLTVAALWFGWSLPNSKRVANETRQVTGQREAKMTVRSLQDVLPAAAPEAQVSTADPAQAESPKPRPVRGPPKRRLGTRPVPSAVLAPSATESANEPELSAKPSGTKANVIKNWEW